MSNDLFKVKFLNRNNGIIIGDSVLLKTTNGGVNWNRMEITSAHLKDVFILNDRISSIPCSNGRIIKSNDFWNTWSIQNTNLSENISRVFFSDTLNGKCISENGKVIKTTNGGITWSNISNLNLNKVNNAFFKNSNIIITIGDSGNVRFTSNGGVNWLNRNINRNVNLHSIYLDEDNKLYVSGDNGLILFSSNSGTSWEDQPTNLTSKINKIGFFDKNSGIAVSDAGEILLTSLGTIEIGTDHGLLSNYTATSDIYQSRNLSFTLNQNYPNPFNPKTQIKFTIAENTLVVLKVYDVLGKEVKTLVNESLERGNHIVYFDGTELASGIYFYKITAGNYVEQKQMLLIK